MSSDHEGTNMLRRQRIILSLLDRAGSPLQRTLLVKLAFLLRVETLVAEECAFYDFVPHKYGPFSFVLYHELGRMEREGYVSVHPHHVAISAAGRGLAWGRHDVRMDPVGRCICAVIRSYGSTGLPALIEYVYNRYGWYATRSEHEQSCPESLRSDTCAPVAVYTMGYEGTSVDSFFNTLLEAGIRWIVDVRANPVSRKYGFSKGALSGIARDLGINYKHVPALGIPSRLRQCLGDIASYKRLLDVYQSEMLPQHEPELSELAALFRETPSALVCMENDPSRCHRARLAMALSNETGLPIRHL